MHTLIDLATVVGGLAGAAAAAINLAAAIRSQQRNSRDRRPRR